MNTVLDKMISYVEKDKQLNLSDLENQIKSRILTQFTIRVKKLKLGFWAKYSIPAMFFALMLGPLIFYSYFSVSHYNTSLLDLSWFMSGVFCICFLIVSLITNFGRNANGDNHLNPYKTNGVNIKNYFKGYFNFEKESKNYFSSFDLPLDTEKEIKQYMIEKNDRFFCKEQIIDEELNSILKLTSEEMNKLKNVHLNNFQRQLLINTINKNKEFSLANVQEIMQFNNVEILKENRKYLL